MRQDPVVSVVMGVHDPGEGLEATLDSVLEQDGVAIELIVVDDGSTDDTLSLLETRARRDPRVRVLRQPRNLGLTAALIRGCAAAAGRYIARQDAGDRSLPGRLAAQAAWLDAHPDAVMVSCHARLLGLHGELVQEIRIAEAALMHGLTTGRNDGFSGPAHHGTVMMRADAYRRAGGYRQPFVVAQDLDLWLRLVELGPVGVLDRVGYEAQASPSGISAQRLRLQRRLAALAAEAARVRRAGGDERAVLAGFEVAPRPGWIDSAGARRYRHAAYLYFLGRCVGRRDPLLARRYFRDGIARCPWHLRSWYGLAATWFATRPHAGAGD